MVWKDKNGKKHNIKNMSFEYLQRVKKLIEKWAEDGFVIEYGDNWDNDPFYDCEIIYGNNVLEEFGYYEIVKEIELREIQKQIK